MSTTAKRNELDLILESAQRETQAFVEATLPRAFDDLLIQYVAHLCHELIWKANIKFAQTSHDGSVEVEHELPGAILSTIEESTLDFEVLVLERLEGKWLHGHAKTDLHQGNFRGDAWTQGLFVKFHKH